ncbi:MAG: extracellular solute-binding protein family 1 [Chloroflexi bacterium]|nr:extracellular solute-binding protein family 1 [Chloroflexota bacterium]
MRHIEEEKRVRRIVMAIATAAIVVAACTGAATPQPTGGPTVGPGESPTPVPTEASLVGTKVEVFGAFRGDEGIRFEESFKAFEDATGVDVLYSGSDQFETLVNTRAEAGNPPDIAAFPQPGGMRRLAAEGFLIPLPQDIIDAIDANYGPGWMETGTGDDGNVYGVFHRVNIKSLVFYPKKAFEAAGYTAPTTWDELTALAAEIKAAGSSPWCVTMESGGATGWVATDWVEDIMLRTAGPETYDKWVTHQIPFNDPSVKEAIETLGSIWLDQTQVYGGTTNILATFFGEAGTPMFDNPPKCWLLKQGSFITGFFPDAVKADLDNEVGSFAFPSVDPQFGTPALGGGDQFVMFSDRPEVRAFLAYLTTGASGSTWAAAGGALFPHKDQDLGAYASALDRAAAEQLLAADSFRFDGSDLMPAAVGAGTFWKGMVDYVSGTKDLDTVLDEIEASWP